MMKQILFLCVPLALASSRVQLEPDVTFPAETGQWSRSSQPQADALMTVRIMMKHDEAGMQALEKALMAVSDPSSAFYGQHLTSDQLADVSPISDAHVAVVMAHLASAKHGTDIDTNPHRDIITATMEVRDVERLFETTIHEYRHKERSNVSLLRASRHYSVPTDLADAVAVVGDLVSLPRLRRTVAESDANVGGSGQWPNSCSLSGCAGLITPAVLRERYSVPNETALDAVAGNSMAVAEFQGQYFKQTDLDAFSKGCKTNVTVDTIVGGNEQSAGVEAELDIEYIRGVSPSVPLTVIYSAHFSLLDWMTQVSKMTNPPLVNSVSYGNDEKQQTSVAYMYSCNAQFMKAGVRGISVLFASGDQGVCGREGCGDGVAAHKKRFKPDFPGGSPYITVVGGTDFKGAGIGEETAWSSGGGGFSDTFGIPSWQATAVKAYKANPSAKLPNSSMYNNTGRGYPDISALGGRKTPYCVVVNGNPAGVAGTSASCPTASAIFARLNGLRLAAGKKALGFLNPFIYKNGAAFNDVTSGCNSGGSSKTNCFTAVKGWDPATGMGTPNYAKLAKAVNALP